MTVLLIRGLGSERDKAEQEVVDSGIPLPLPYRMVWAANLHRWETCFLLARDRDGRARAGVAVERIPTRAMPGHQILRVRRFGEGLTHGVCKALLSALNCLARKLPRVLRVQVQVFSRESRDEICRMLSGLGYRELPEPSVYRHTLVVDLKPSEEEIFARINESGRNKIRKTIRKSLQCKPIDDQIYADQIRILQQEALDRTGGHIASEDWRGVLRMSKERPKLSRVFGLFNGEDNSPESMAAFGWVCNHGDNGEYRAAGSTRRGDVKIPFGYLVGWEMIRWSKAVGAEWFDFGGVTLSKGHEDPLKGISDFKRSFSREIAEVGAEWAFDQMPLRANVAQAVSTCIKHLRNSIGRG